MIPHGHPWLISALLVLTFAAANRLWGAGDRGGALHLKAIATVLALAVTLALHWPLAVFAVGWFLWRFVAPGAMGGSLAPSSGQVVPTFLHHLLLTAPAFVGGVIICHWPALAGTWWWAPAAMLAFATLATFDARENALQAVKGRDINWACELTTGGGFGALAAVLAVLS